VYNYIIGIFDFTIELKQLMLKGYIAILFFLGVHTCLAQNNVVYCSPTQNLKTTIEALPNNSTLILTSGRHYIREEVRLINKKNIRITSSHKSITEIVIDSSVYIGICLLNHLENIRIDNLNIRGQLQNQRITIPTYGTVATHAIATHWGNNIEIRNITIRDNYIKNIAVGISIGASNHLTCEGNIYDHVLIEKNTIENIYGETGGSGYGIHNECATNVIVRDNKIINATRHSIYQARGEGKVNIQKNIVIGHGKLRQSSTTYYRAAICVARSNNIVVANNSIIASQDVSLSIEHDHNEAITSKVCRNIYVIQNIFSQSPILYPQIWVNSNTKESISLKNNISSNLFTLPIVKISNGVVNGQFFLSFTMLRLLIAGIIFILPLLYSWFLLSKKPITTFLQFLILYSFTVAFLMAFFRYWYK
jgi:hypothetical protein